MIVISMAIIAAEYLSLVNYVTRPKPYFLFFKNCINLPNSGSASV